MSVSKLNSKLSFAKKKTLGNDGLLQSTIFAVVPYEIQFQKNVDYNTAIYFQKNYQILGEITPVIASNSRGKKLQLQADKNIITFRLFNEKNLGYKFSIYERNNKSVGSEESFIQSGVIQFKQAIKEFISPKNNPSVHTPQSLIDLGFLCKEQRQLFPKIGIILNYAIFVSEDERDIIEAVRTNYKHSQCNQLKVEPTMMNMELSSKRESRRDNLSLGQDSNKLEQLQPSSHSKNPLFQGIKSTQDDNIKENTDHLSNAILQDQNQKLSSANLDDLILNGPTIEQLSENKENHRDELRVKVPDTIKKLVSNTDSEGYLRLESNEGRYGPIAKKQNIKEFNDLDEIEQNQEEKKSAAPMSPMFKESLSSLIKDNEKSPILIKNNRSSESEVTPLKIRKVFSVSDESEERRIKIKRIAISVIILLILGILAAMSMSANSLDKKHKRKRRNDQRQK